MRANNYTANLNIFETRGSPLCSCDTNVVGFLLFLFLIIHHRNVFFVGISFKGTTTILDWKKFILSVNNQLSITINVVKINTHVLAFFYCMSRF